MICGLHVHVFAVDGPFRAAIDRLVIRYPLNGILGSLALRSQRRRCLVGGQDFGTVPEEFREKMAAANVANRAPIFEQKWNKGGFSTSQGSSRLALAVAGSQDLPILVGWLEGRDIDLDKRLDLYPNVDEAPSQRELRGQDRRGMLEAFRKEELLVGQGDSSSEQFAKAAHELLARSGSGLVLPQLDNRFAEADQVNVENPNWRRKYRVVFEEMALSVERLPGLRKYHGRGDHAT
jgi:(1->4)-alpha-D-glucan 1-alpha-D-glucosylmutase